MPKIERFLVWLADEMNQMRRELDDIPASSATMWVTFFFITGCSGKSHHRQQHARTLYGINGRSHSS